jgi:putative ABC transport system substrate-binding protein
VIARRELLIAIGAAAFASPLAPLAQTKIWRVGFLGALSPAKYSSYTDALRTGLRELGYVEGRDLVIEYRWADEKYERLPVLAAELVRLNVDVIVTHATPPTRAAMQATSTIPIVMGTTSDPVANKLVASLARPGGNVTGSSFFVPELSAKRIELLKEILPHSLHIGVLTNLDNGGLKASLDAMKTTAQSLKVELQEFGVRNPRDFEGAFAAIRKSAVEAVIVSEDPMLDASASALTKLAAARRIPLGGFRECAESGGLFGYGIDRVELWRRAAVFVDKILKGAKPGDLPVERATKFEFVVNVKTAKILGVTVPPTILVRADKVIE